MGKDGQWALIGANKVIHSGKQAYFKALSLLGYNSGYSALYLYCILYECIGDGERVGKRQRESDEMVSNEWRG